MGAAPNLNSSELLRLLQDGDSQAAATIFDKYVARLVALARARIRPRLARRIDAEDVVQSAYRSFFAHAQNDEYSLTESGDLWRLLASITLNKLYGQVEKHTAARRSIEREEESGGDVNDSAPEPTPVEIVAFAELLQLISARLSSLEQAVLIAYLHGKDNDEISAELSKSPRTVRRLLAQVQKRVEHELFASRVLVGRDEKLHSRRALDTRVTLSYSDFVLEKLLGAGGMGKVYRSTRRSTGKQVAIKSLLKSRQADRHAVEKFLQEAQILAHLHHPNIVGIQGVGQFPGGGYFLAMDFVDGTDLQSRIANGPLAIKESVQLVRVVAVAIAYAHDRGVVHGDLKPANILIDSSNKVIVTDFGLAQFIAHGTAPTKPHWLVGGTAGFIAPEVQARGTVPTPAADIFGLGALLCALATGTVPNVADSLQFDSVMPNDLACICARCVAVNPSDRFRNVIELETQLRKFDKNTPSR